MDSESYDAVQQGLLMCLLAVDHEQRLAAFLDGLRREGQWSNQQLDEVAAKIREMLGASPLNCEPVTDTVRLSQREKETLMFLARGFTGKELAERFELSAKTIETYKQRALRKLGLETRADIVQFAISQGWLGRSADAQNGHAGGDSR